MFICVPSLAASISVEVRIQCDEIWKERLFWPGINAMGLVYDLARKQGEYMKGLKLQWWVGTIPLQTESFTIRILCEYLR